MREVSVIAKSILCLGLLASQSLYADGGEEETSTESLNDNDRATALEFTQKELQSKFQSGFGLELGKVMPWSDVGAAVLGRTGSSISTLSLGFGRYKYSGELDSRNYQVAGKAQSAYAASRWFVLGFGPIYLEPIVGLVHWNGDVKPRTTDKLTDIEASSLTSRYDLIGLDVGANLGLMWIFGNGVFLDYNLMNISHALLLKETYTVSTTESRKAVRAQIAGPVTMIGLNLRIGYSYDF